jgi:hypothetical protein
MAFLAAMRRFQTMVVGIPEPTAEEQVEGQAHRDREALVHALFQHPWLVTMAEGNLIHSARAVAQMAEPVLTPAAALKGLKASLASAGGPVAPGKNVTPAAVIRCDPEPPPARAVPATDAVHRPAHYTWHPSGIEIIEITRWMGFNTGNAMKYLFRAGHKDPDAREDLRKAIRYIEYELENLEREHRPASGGAESA